MSVEYKIYLDPLPSSALDTDNEEQRPGNYSVDAVDHCIPCFAAELCHSVGTFQGPKLAPVCTVARLPPISGQAVSGVVLVT